MQIRKSNSFLLHCFGLLVLITLAPSPSHAAIQDATAAQNQKPQGQGTNEPVFTSKNKAELQQPPHLVEGHDVEWEGWKFKWQVREIEGLVLTDVSFDGKSVLKYIGLAEIYVPYATGQPRPVDFSLGGFKDNPMRIEVARDCYAKGSCKACLLYTSPSPRDS